MVEYLDIVNEEDEVIGKDTRKNIHDKYKIHRGTHIFVINSKGDLLLQKRSLKKKYYPGFYDASVGCQVLSGESYEEAAIRETKEELGFTPDKLVLICDYNSYSKRQREKRRLFVCYYNGPFNLNESCDEEVEFVKFYPVETIKEDIRSRKKKFTEGFKISFQKYLKTLR